MKDSAKRFLHVIVDWTDAEVWQFIKEQNLPYCSLYDEGWKRIGCLFCPIQSNKTKAKEVERYPKYVAAFIRAFERLYANRKAAGNASVDRWKNGEEMFWWWIKEEKENKEDSQPVLFE